MISFLGEEVEKVLQARVLQRGETAKGIGLSTDSRTVKTGQLFFALQGPHFDGHRFIDSVLEKGAWGVVGSQVQSSKSWMFKVPDTLKALGDLAGWWRQQFHVPCVGLTGSNGKTTTKEMIASILSQKGNVLKTEGNFNNLIGLPLTVAQWGKEHSFAVLEMGMSEFGEIRRLTEIAAPTVGCITNVAPAHLEKLGSLDSVAKAKGEMFAAMSADGTIAVNAEDPLVVKQAENFRGRKILFGMKKQCGVRFEHLEQETLDAMDLKFSVAGKKASVRLCAAGLHNVMNALAAAAVGEAVGIEVEAIVAGLEKFRPLKMRLEQTQLGNGVRLVNDAYNANPASMITAFRTVGAARRAGRFIAVLGTMLELGDAEKSLHREIGMKVVEHGAQKLFLVGAQAEQIKKGAMQAGLNEKEIVIAEKKEDLHDLLDQMLKAGDVVLIKASRGVGLETVAEFLKDKYGI